ncbi:hypothetical protein Bca101_057122 [Brassica carinata]
MTKKKKPKEKRRPGTSPSGSAARSGSSSSPVSSSAPLKSAVDAAASNPPIEEARLPGSLPASSPSTEFQGPPPQIVVSAGNPNSQASATVEIVPENQDLEATSTNYATGEHPQSPVRSDVEIPSTTPAQQTAPHQSEVKTQATLWKEKVSPNSARLDPVETPFMLDSGEACVKIPNSVIERNRKAWDSFIIGQFYEEAPARAAVQAIVNGMWSKHRRDIAVSKMDGNAFLFRVPCPNARRRILAQCLWQVDGQTMFVAKWAPGITPEKPALSTVPVWLDFHGVPLQFFNKDALKEIAGIVGHPICLHPATENLTNIEVAKVYTVIDPREPLPEAVNAQFECGEVVRIGVSCPWLPSLCSHCSKVGHTISKCPAAPPRCLICRSVKHSTDVCTRTNANKSNGNGNGKAPIPSQYPIVGSSGPNTKSKKRSVPILSKGKPPASQRWERADNENLVDLPRNNPPAIGSSRQAASLKQHDVSSGKLFVDLTPENFESPIISSNGTSEDEDPDPGSEGTSNDEDIPCDEDDQYIRMMFAEGEEPVGVRVLTYQSSRSINTILNALETRRSST